MDPGNGSKLYLQIDPSRSFTGSTILYSVSDTQMMFQIGESSLRAPGVAVVRVRVPLSNVSNVVNAPPPAVKPAVVARAPAADQPFAVMCKVAPESLETLSGPVSYAVHLRCRLNGAAWTVHHRFREFDALHTCLSKSERYSGLPALPPKLLGIRHQPAALAQRAEALTAYCTELLMRPNMVISDDVSAFFELSRGLWREDAESCETAQHRAACCIQRECRRRAASAMAIRRLIGIFTLQALMRNALNDRIQQRLIARRRVNAAMMLQRAWRTTAARQAEEQREMARRIEMAEIASRREMARRRDVAMLDSGLAQDVFSVLGAMGHMHY